MRTLTKILSAVCVLLLLLSAFSLSAFAADSNITYTGVSGNLIFEPGSEHSPTDLFDNFKNVMPGASLTQKITLKNNADNRVTVKIYLRSLGSESPEYNDFLNQLTLTVTKVSETPMFEASADKTAGLTDWVCLGTLYSGGSVDINVTLDVPKELDNKYQNSIGKIKWQFVAEEYAVCLPKWKCPENSKHRYHIEEKNGVSTFVCDECKAEETMKCEKCGSNMREAMVVIIGGNTYTAYPDGAKHYKTEDGKVHFYLNGDEIIDYYTVDGKNISIKDVSEYKLFTYYECLKDKNHHTDPEPSPVTRDNTSVIIWAVIAVLSGGGLIVLLILRRKKDNRGDRAKC